MPERIPHNSESLKARFPEVYREFFSKCALVCSAPRSITWVGEHTVRVGGITMRQAIPMRTYVGVVPINTPGVTIASNLTFDPLVQAFRKGMIDDGHERKLERELLPFLKRMGVPFHDKGLNIHILTELPFERAMGSVGSLLVPLFVGVLLHAKMLSREQVAQWANKAVVDLQKDQGIKFDAVFRLIWKWESVVYLTPSATNPFVAMLPSPVPIIFASKRPFTEEEMMGKIVRGAPMDHFAIIDQAKYWGARTNEIFEEHVGWPLPFDYGVISISEGWAVRETVFSIAELQHNLQKTLDEIIEIAGRLFGDVDKAVLPEFFQLYLSESRKQIWQYYIGPLSLLSFQALMGFKKIIERGFSKKEVSVLFDTLNKVHAALYPLNFCSEVMDRTIHALRTLIYAKVGSGNIGAKMNSTSRRGNILFAVPTSIVRPWMPEVVEALRQQVDTKISLDYASWIDGYEEEGGVKIEQWLEKGIHSPFLAADAVRLIQWTKKGEVRTSISKRAAPGSVGRDILIDMVHEKIQVAGKECTSRELPSQKATVAILDALLTAEGHRLHNRAFPESGYTKYRNEFQGKITGPLVALVKKRLKKDLDLKVEGTLTDFWVSLDPKGFEIGVIKKMA